jgi:hypothetical protein
VGRKADLAFRKIRKWLENHISRVKVKTQIAALILGIVGGLWGLAIGVTSLVAEIHWAEFWGKSVAMATVGQVVAITIFSIVAIVAASLARRRSTLAGILMLVTVLAYFLIGIHYIDVFVFLFAMIFLFVAGILALASSRKRTP